MMRSWGLVPAFRPPASAILSELLDIFEKEFPRIDATYVAKKRVSIEKLNYGTPSGF